MQITLADTKSLQSQNGGLTNPNSKITDHGHLLCIVIEPGYSKYGTVTRCPWNTLHMSNTCQESRGTSSTRVPYLYALGLMSSTGQREGEGRVLRSSNNKNKIKKKGVAPYLLKSMLIKT